ncbi:MAG TPA: hypothetical protein VF980_00630 [Thermoanaerobaculia bacterium]
MKRVSCLLAVFFAGAVLSSCALATYSRVPEPSIYICQVSPRVRQAVQFAGPLPVECELTISNSSRDQIVIDAVELHSIAGGAFRFQTPTMPVTFVIPPGDTIVFDVDLWAYSEGGDFSGRAPVSIRGTAWFEARPGERQRVAFRTVL